MKNLPENIEKKHHLKDNASFMKINLTALPLRAVL